MSSGQAQKHEEEQFRRISEIYKQNELVGKQQEVALKQIALRREISTGEVKCIPWKLRNWTELIQEDTTLISSSR
jgi:hypothetical protein